MVLGGEKGASFPVTSPMGSRPYSCLPSPGCRLSPLSQFQLSLSAGLGSPYIYPAIAAGTEFPLFPGLLKNIQGLLELPGPLSRLAFQPKEISKLIKPKQQYFTPKPGLTALSKLCWGLSSPSFNNPRKETPVHLGLSMGAGSCAGLAQKKSAWWQRG